MYCASAALYEYRRVSNEAFIGEMIDRDEVEKSDIADEERCVEIYCVR